MNTPLMTSSSDSRNEERVIPKQSEENAAPEKGLSIERVFTTPGSDPLEEVSTRSVSVTSRIQTGP